MQTKLPIAFTSNFGNFNQCPQLFGGYHDFWKKLQWNFRNLLMFYQSCFVLHILIASTFDKTSLISYLYTGRLPLY